MFSGDAYYLIPPTSLPGPWTKEEDEKVVDLVKKYGPKRWTLIAKHLKGRIGKQCRERWHNHLNPEIKKTAWTEEEVNSFLLYSSVSDSGFNQLSKFVSGFCIRIQKGKNGP
jgi:hypothetical protein